MNYPSCIHTHTQFCDGRSTMEEIAQTAADAGFVSLGFSPHSPLPYDNDWAMREEDFPAFFSEIASLRERFRGRMEIFAGLEWDADSGELPQGLDYVIGAVHSLVKNGERFAVDYSRELLLDVLSRLYGGDFTALCRDYYAAVAAAALRPRVQVVAHFDLLTKYNSDGFFIDENHPAYLQIAEDALDAIFSVRKDLFFEVNTGVMARAGKSYPYPAPALLSAIHRRGGQFVINSDCHRAHQLTAGYGAALRLLSELDGARLYLFRSGAFRPFPL